MIVILGNLLIPLLNRIEYAVKLLKFLYLLNHSVENGDATKLRENGHSGPQRSVA